MTPLQLAAYAAQGCAAISAHAVARRRPEYAPAALALAVLAAASWLDGVTAAGLSVAPSSHVLVYLDGALNLATSAAVAGLAVAVAVAPERRRLAAAIVGAVWLLASVVLGALYPSPLVRGEGLHRVYFAADLFGICISTVALITWARAAIAAKRSPDAVASVALGLVTFDAAILLAPFSPWRGALFAAPYTGPQLVITVFFAVVATAQVTAWKLSPVQSDRLVHALRRVRPALHRRPRTAARARGARRTARRAPAGARAPRARDRHGRPRASRGAAAGRNHRATADLRPPARGQRWPSHAALDPGGRRRATDQQPPAASGAGAAARARGDDRRAAGALSPSLSRRGVRGLRLRLHVRALRPRAGRAPALATVAVQAQRGVIQARVSGSLRWYPPRVVKRRTQRNLASHLSDPEVEADAARVRAEILAAWTGDAPPGSIPPHCQRPDCPAIAAYFSGKTWQDVRIHEMRKAVGASFDNVLPFLTPAAFRHFLAAFLLAFLDDPHALGTFAAPLVQSLCPSPGWRGPVEQLSREQQCAVLSFLRHVANARHWQPPVDEGIRFGERRTAG